MRKALIFALTLAMMLSVCACGNKQNENKPSKAYSSTGDLTSSDSVLNVDVMDKLTNSCNINISIPEVYIPNIEMPVLRAA